jgi:hypothetical protein
MTMVDAASTELPDLTLTYYQSEKTNPTYLQDIGK